MIPFLCLDHMGRMDYGYITNQPTNRLTLSRVNVSKSIMSIVE